MVSKQSRLWPEILKRALSIVGVVTLYCWLATVFLLSFLLPSVWYYSTGYRAFVGWSQFAVIPGIAALFSRYIYGRRGWLRRAVKIILAGSIGLAVCLTALLSSAAAIAWAASVNAILFVVLLVLLGGGIILATAWLAGKISRRSIPIESARWLEERQRGTGADDRKWMNRGIRWALWIPSLTVLLAGGFFLPVWGMLSRLAQPRVAYASGFDVPVPLNWVVNDSYHAGGYSRASGLAGQGSPLFGIFDPQDFQIADWTFWVPVSNGSPPVNPAFPPPIDENITGHRQFAIGDGIIECREYLPKYLQSVNGRDSPTVFVDCRGSNGWYAGFGGAKTLLPSFYRILEGTKKIK